MRVNGHRHAGDVYVYVRSGAGWSQQAKLESPDRVWAFFGSMVALSGETAVVSSDGSLFVYVRSGGAWSRQAEIHAAGAALGGPVALSGNTAVVGGFPRGTVRGQPAGEAAVYVFVRTGTRWSLQAELTPSDASSKLDFDPAALALSGNTALVGDAFEEVGGKWEAGAAWVFVRAGGKWTEQTVWHAPRPAAQGSFGSSVALSGNAALIGACNQVVGNHLGAGVVYLFARSGRRWALEHEFSAAQASRSEAFGSSVALSADAVLVGAPLESVAGQGGAGAAYLFVHSGVGWTQELLLHAARPMTGDEFGFSVGLSGSTVLVAAPFATVGKRGFNAGTAYMFEIPGQ